MLDCEIAQHQLQEYNVVLDNAILEANQDKRYKHVQHEPSFLT